MKYLKGNVFILLSIFLNTRTTFFQRKVCHGDFHGVPLSVLMNQETMLFHLADDALCTLKGYIGEACSKTIENVSLIGIE